MNSKRVVILLTAFLALVSCEKERLFDGGTTPEDRISYRSRPLENKGRKSVEKFAKKLDTNSDGFVDYDELFNWINRSFVSADIREAQDRMHEYDVNGDGFVTWEEYVLDAFQPNFKNEGDDILQEQDRLYFEQADLDKDGKLNLKELTAFLSPENNEHMHDVIVKVTLMEKDENHDNAISLSEYLGDIADQKNSEWYNIEKDRFYNEYDTDKDGQLTGDEIKKWLVPGPTVFGESEARHLIDMSDEDDDGKLSYEEIINHHLLFAKTDAAREGDDHPYDHEEL
ncbi:unnamed protein product [Caenorhabditis bovis]|uniref:EF-hand domain-containing protein n=1 Tax=Caenorhabditis bovis TaxID=2654633 RepID=A0A8S1F4G0_9PELO|nr:unnamed protein product [Caenorhabditis bovis]